MKLRSRYRVSRQKKLWRRDGIDQRMLRTPLRPGIQPTIVARVIMQCGVNFVLVALLEQIKRWLSIVAIREPLRFE